MRRHRANEAFGGRRASRVVARVLCALFATLGAIPLLLFTLARTPWVRARIAHVTERALAQRGVTAAYGIDVSLAPLAVELRDMRISSTDGGPPALYAPYARIRPRLGALLSGRVAIDRVDVDAPRVRVVVENGQVVNLDLPKLNEQPGRAGPFHAPLRAASVTDATIDVTIDGARVVASGVDVDAFVDDDPREGSTVDMRVLGERVELARTSEGATYEDVLCGVESRLEVGPSGAFVEHLDAQGAADVDGAARTRPACDLPLSDERRLELSLRDVRIGAKGAPPIAGHVHVRAPVALAERAAELPETAGWISADVDARWDADQPLPEARGTVEGAGLRIGQFSIARHLRGDVALVGGHLSSAETVLDLGKGTLALRDVEIALLARGLPIRARAELANADLAGMLKDLGIAAHPHVTWALDRARVEPLTGTLSPLAISGPLVGRSGPFVLYDAAIDRSDRARVIGGPPADLRARLVIDASAIQFRDIGATLPRGTVEGGFASIGFHDDLLVELPRIDVDLADATPLAQLPIAGRARISLRVAGKAGNPRVEGDGAIDAFVFDGHPLGDVDAVRFALDVPTLMLSDLHARVGTSAYLVPSMRLVFGGEGRLDVDALVESKALGLRDLVAMNGTPAPPWLGGVVSDGRADVHYTRGGKEDVCHAGALDVGAHAKLADVDVYGETFEEAAVDFDLRWPDTRAGLGGADLDVHSLSLQKHRPKPHGPQIASVFASGSLHDGAVDARASVQAFPLAEVHALGAVAREVEGNVSALVAMEGPLDALTLTADAGTSAVRIRGVPFGASAMHVEVGPTAARRSPRGGAAHCGPRAAIVPELATERLEATGDLLDGQAHVRSLRLLADPEPVLEAVVDFDHVDLDAISQAASAPPAPGTVQRPASVVQGSLTGRLEIARLPLLDPSRASAVFTPSATDVAVDGGHAFLRRSGPLRLDRDRLSIPETSFEVETRGGQRTSVDVRGAIDHLTTRPVLDVDVASAELDLGALVGLVPNVERASGKAQGAATLEGPLAHPDVAGLVVVRGATLGIRGIPADVTDLDAQLAFDRGALRVKSATARLGGGKLDASGVLPLANGGSLARASVHARDVHLEVAKGIEGTFDADADVTIDPKRLFSGEPESVHVTGDVLAKTLAYTRPVRLTTDITAVGERAAHTQRTEVDESYDPAKDAIILSLQVHAAQPIEVRNDLAEARVEVPPEGLLLRGSNQRVALVGELRALPGGRLRVSGYDFAIREATLRFDDPTRIAPSIDVVATTEYRRMSDMAAPFGSVVTGLDTVTSGDTFHLTVHAYGPVDDVKLAFSSDPPLSQDDVVLLLTVGLTRSELDLMQAQAGSFTSSAGFEALASLSGAARLVKNAVPIDDFRFGSGYVPRAARVEPELTIGKRLGRNVGATLSTGLGEERDVRTNIEVRVTPTISLETSYDNVPRVNAEIGNLGFGVRWRLEIR